MMKYLGDYTAEFAWYDGIKKVYEDGIERDKKAKQATRNKGTEIRRNITNTTDKTKESLERFKKSANEASQKFNSGMGQRVQKAVKNTTQDMLNQGSTIGVGKKFLENSTKEGVDGILAGAERGVKERYLPLIKKHKRKLIGAGALGVGLLGLNVASGVKNTIDLARGTKNLVFRKKKDKELGKVGNYRLIKGS